MESKSQEETLLGFAIWGPPHGRYRMLNYPWKNYVKVSSALRHCAFMVIALHGCLLSEIQVEESNWKSRKMEMQQYCAHEWKSILGAIADFENSKGGFDCNICSDFAHEPVVTLCGRTAGLASTNGFTSRAPSLHLMSALFARNKMYLKWNVAMCSECFEAIHPSGFTLPL